MKYHGILPVYKPKGLTSHDVVHKIRGIVRQKKIGHTGTLDPEVEGVLPICLGQATRIAEYIQNIPKRYQGSLVLGISTDTQDLTGKIIQETTVSSVCQSLVEKVFMNFTGVINQVPPMYSAIKVNGKRLYELARLGETIDRPPRKVKVYELRCLDIESGQHPVIHFDVLCSKGTYVRTLCVDIGASLGFPASMKSLNRITSGPFHIEDCLTLDSISQLEKSGKLLETLYPLGDVLSHFPSLIVSKEEENDVLNGLPLILDHQEDSSSLFRVYSESGRFCALYQWDKDDKLFLPEKVFRDV